MIAYHFLKEFHIKKFMLLGVVLICPITHSSIIRNDRLAHYDLTLIGPLNFNDGIGRISVGIIDCLENDVSINWIPTLPIGPQSNLSDHVMRAVNNNNDVAGHVCIFTEILWKPGLLFIDKIPQESLIKFAFSMHESTAIPEQWVMLLNGNFDAVLVPDPWCVDIYKNSGVTIPIFVLPLVTYLDDFLSARPKQHKSVPFIFGNLSGTWNRKNIPFLMEAFVKAFEKTQANVKLVIKTRGGDDWKEAYALHKKYKNKNIFFKIHGMSWKNYVSAMANFNCYVSFSKGEGFSFSPREAMALGIPVIISDNSAHRTICESGLVKAVKSDILEPAYFSLFNAEYGHCYGTSLTDAVKAFQDVYYNYEKYLKKIPSARNWVKQYQAHQLKKKYLNVIKPKQVLLGNENIITDDFIMTNSEALYKKYSELRNILNT
jgi:glycosyltransferase involved in cell wall biosynthesis